MKNIRRCCCILCKNEVAINQLDRHYGSAQCTKGKCGFTKNTAPKNLFCFYCDKECKNLNSLKNHERLCAKNPNRMPHPKGMLGKESWNKGKTKETDPRIMQQKETLLHSIATGKVIPRRTSHTDEYKDRMSILACERLQKHSKYSKNIEYNGAILESTFELRTAQILDELDIKWIKVRQGYVWDDNGKRRRYVPDFYLPDFDVFLDPKNDYLIKKDKRKIESAMSINNIKVFVLSESQITEEYIKDCLR
jgi:hypothetical protein